MKKDKGMKYQCATCKIDVDNKSNMKIHWEVCCFCGRVGRSVDGRHADKLQAKHPKLPTPGDDFASMEKVAKDTK